MTKIVDVIFEVAERIAAFPAWVQMRVCNLNTDMMPASAKKTATA